jgi:hypothetical protein
MAREARSIAEKTVLRAPLDWTAWGDRWEYSHVLRAGLATVGFMALVITISC